jgi:hypothetical protein
LPETLCSVWVEIAAEKRMRAGESQGCAPLGQTAPKAAKFSPYRPGYPAFAAPKPKNAANRDQIGPRPS